MRYNNIKYSIDFSVVPEISWNSSVRNNEDVTAKGRSKDFYYIWIGIKRNIDSKHKIPRIRSQKFNSTLSDTHLDNLQTIQLFRLDRFDTQLKQNVP